jgi:hypothetical protein
MTMTMAERDLRARIAGERAQAKHHRRQAQALRAHRIRCREQRDPIGALHALMAIHERERCARAHEAQARALKAQLGPTARAERRRTAAVARPVSERLAGLYADEQTETALRTAFPEKPR